MPTLWLEGANIFRVLPKDYYLDTLAQGHRLSLLSRAPIPCLGSNVYLFNDPSNGPISESELATELGISFYEYLGEGSCMGYEDRFSSSHVWDGVSLACIEPFIHGQDGPTPRVVLPAPLIKNSCFRPLGYK